MTIERQSYEKGWGRCTRCEAMRPLREMEIPAGATVSERLQPWRCKDLDDCNEQRMAGYAAKSGYLVFEPTAPKPAGSFTAFVGGVRRDGPTKPAISPTSTVPDDSGAAVVTRFAKRGRK